MIHGKKLMAAQLIMAGIARDDVQDTVGISRATYYRYAKDNAVREYMAEYTQDIAIREEALEALRQAVRRGSVPAIRLALAKMEPKKETTAVSIIDDIPDIAGTLRQLVEKHGKADTLTLISNELEKIPDKPPTQPLARSVVDE